ncbi:protein FAM200C-like [Palaemon carinicauda]|uniref:protein FAM200C-like n=1 Tax=Palaemon carinicauda TaxID=392227 RepID=UPI0035B651E2
MVEHMQMLCTSFDGYVSCGELQACNIWILNPFMQNLEDVDDDGSIKEDLLDMRHNRGIQMEFTNSHVDHFLASQLEAYPALATKALKVLLYTNIHTAPKKHTNSKEMVNTRQYNTLPIETVLMKAGVKTAQEEKGIKSWRENVVKTERVLFLLVSHEYKMMLRVNLMAM